MNRIALCVLWFGLISASAWGTAVVVPGEFETQPGSANNTLPFDDHPDGVRLQQLYGANLFGGENGWITGLAYRVDEVFGGPIDNGQLDLEIRISTVATAIGDLSFAFVDNPGSDELLVLDGVISVSSIGIGSFDVIMKFEQAFFYDGISNLLLDFKVYSSDVFTAFDATFSDDWQRMGGCLCEVAADWTDQYGLITQFQFATAVPEPSTSACLALACWGFLSDDESPRTRSKIPSSGIHGRRKPVG